MTNPNPNGAPSNEPWPWHPALLGVGWIAANYVDTGVHLESTFRALAAVILGVILIGSILQLLTRNLHVAGIVATAVLAIVLMADPVAALYVGTGFIAATAGYLLARSTAFSSLRLRHVSKGLNVVAGLFLLVSLFPGVTNGTLGVAFDDAIGRIRSSPADPGDAQLPDIYVVVLDGYPRNDTVAARLGSDNSGFTDALEGRGFEVARESTSGYMYTDLAFTALFHGRDLVDLPQLEPVLAGADLPALDRQVLNEAPLLEVFRRHGYTTIANAQAWDEPALRRVDRYVDGSGLNEFERHLLRGTLIGSTWEVMDEGLEAALIAPWVADAFEFLRAAPAIDVPGPRFVFAHVPSPHFPIIFKADGSRAEARYATAHPDQVHEPESTVIDAYLGQMAFLDRSLLDAFEAMSLPADAVVIVMSDHGPEFGLNWSSGADSDLEVRFASFFASRGSAVDFPPDVFVTEVLAIMAGEILDEPIPLPARRFFSADALDKFTTLTEVDDPWR